MTSIKLPKDLFSAGFVKPGRPVRREPVNIEKIEELQKWIARRLSKSNTHNHRCTSHAISLIAAKDLDREVSNGEMITAMILNGYAYQNGGGLTATFNVCADAVAKLQAA